MSRRAAIAAAVLLIACHEVNPPDSGFDTAESPIGDRVLDPDAEGERAPCYADNDGDGVVGPASVGIAVACEPLGLYTSPGQDCDDRDSRVYPGAPEGTGPDLDFNCDGRARCYADADEDGLRPAEGAFEYQGMTVQSEDGDCDDPGEARASAEGDCRPWEPGGRARNHGPWGCSARWQEWLAGFRAWANSRGDRTN